MANNKKQIKKLKKGHTWIWLIVFTLFIIVSCTLMAFFVSVYGSSFVNAKLDSERAAVQNMINVYETGIQNGNDPSAALEAFGREYLILDGDRKLVYPDTYGTCGIPENPDASSVHVRRSPLNIDSFIFDAMVYHDLKAPVIEQHDEDVDIYIFDILKNVDPYIVPSDRKMFTDEDIKNIDVVKDIRPVAVRRENMVSIPLWIGVKFGGDGSEFIAKCAITVEIFDVILLIIIVASIWGLVLISYIVMIINIITGITRRKKTLKVFFTDAITQGNNYMYFVYKGEELIKKFRNRLSRYHVVSLCYTGYRNYCICHSAGEGEKILAEIYQRLQSAMNGKKEICARVSEADFALLLRDEDDASVKTRLEAIMSTVSHVTDDHVLVFQAGIETIEPVAKTAERKSLDLSEIYNTACAARESLGSDDAGIAFFSEKLIEDRRWAEAVSDRQKAALDNEEFVVYYQPKYDPRTDELKGAEALVRWQSPEFGFVPPGRIIPIFEKNGFITEIDHYMIRHVARDQKRWLDAGFRCVPVSVNVSRAHFIESDLAEQIRDLVDAEGAPHELVEIELTESAFFDDKKALVNTIEKLKSYGFAVSMDDFGSGYSSLNSLKDMPLDVLKLDAEFFRGEDSGERGEIVVSEALRLAKNLNMRTVAEGVEIREQVDFLASQGCDMIQGYFYAKPMPAADYEVCMSERYKPKE